MNVKSITKLFIILILLFITLGFSSNQYTKEEVQYFKEISLGTEYRGDSKIHKWNQDVITVSITGNPKDEHIDYVKVVLFDLMNLIGDKVRFKLIEDDTNADMEIYFGKLNTLDDQSPYYVKGNWGFFSYWWNSEGDITKAQILISTDKMSESEMKHVLKEEITQSLGLGRDSNKYKDSIFYQGWTDTSEYTELDKTLIKVLYEDEIKSGMNLEDIDRLLN